MIRGIEELRTFEIEKDDFFKSWCKNYSDLVNLFKKIKPMFININDFLSHEFNEEGVLDISRYPDRIIKPEVFLQRSWENTEHEHFERADIDFSSYASGPRYVRFWLISNIREFTLNKIKENMNHQIYELMLNRVKELLENKCNDFGFSFRINKMEDQASMLFFNKDFDMSYKGDYFEDFKKFYNKSKILVSNLKKNSGELKRLYYLTKKERKLEENIVKNIKE